MPLQTLPILANKDCKELVRVNEGFLAAQIELGGDEEH